MPDRLRILYEDAHLIAVEKPQGVSTEGGAGPTVPELLEAMGRHCAPVHRLDRETGGLLLLARTPTAAAALSTAMVERRVQKEYRAVTEGRPGEDQGVLRDLLFFDRAKNKSFVVDRPRKGVKEALLDYRALEARDTAEGVLSLLSVTLHTGRSHQIRVQFASRGLPLYGDSRYGSRHRGAPLALWSTRLCFPHPVTGEILELCSPPPTDGVWEIFKM